MLSRVFAFRKPFCEIRITFPFLKNEFGLQSVMRFIWMNKIEKSCLLFTICIYCIQDSETSFNYTVCVFGVAATVLQHN